MLVLRSLQSTPTPEKIDKAKGAVEDA